MRDDREILRAARPPSPPGAAVLDGGRWNWLCLLQAWLLAAMAALRASVLGRLASSRIMPRGGAVAALIAVAVMAHASGAAAAPFSPNGGALPNGTVATHYGASTITTSCSGSGYTALALVTGSLPAGLTPTSQALYDNISDITTFLYTIHGTPTQAGDFTFTLQPPCEASATTFTIKVFGTSNLPISPSAGALPSGSVGNGYSQTVTASGGTAPYSYAVTSGSLPAGLSLNLSTGAITGTPTTPGSYNFNITATDNTGLSTRTVAYSIQINPAPVTLTMTPGNGLWPGSVVGSYYSRTVTASGGTGPYTYAVTSGSLPVGLSLDPTTGVVSGTPTTANTYNFSITATDIYSNTGVGNYSLSTVGAGTLTLSPSSGALPNAMVGEPYSTTIVANGSNLPPYVFTIVSGSLPAGLALDPFAGTISGIPALGTAGEYPFVLRVAALDGEGYTTYTLIVTEQAVSVPGEREVVVPAGTVPGDVNLTLGATGGPFTSAWISPVSPSNAGTAQLIVDEGVYFLRFVPNPTFSGKARVRYTLTGAGGTSNQGTITFIVDFDEEAVARRVEQAVRGFVGTRGGLLSANVRVPGLFERRIMERAAEPITTSMRPGENEIQLGILTSLAQLEAAAENIEVTSRPGSASRPYNVWLDGTLLAHNRPENDNEWGTFGLFSAGADYLLSERALVGISVHVDHTSDPTDDATLTGNGWLAGPYGSLEIVDGVFLDASLRYGGSSNDIEVSVWDGSFDTSRWMADASISGQWQLDEATTLTPELRAVHLEEEVDDYRVSNGSGGVVRLKGFTHEQTRVSLGAELRRRIVLENDLLLTPSLGVTGGYAGQDGSGAFGALAAGISLSNGEDWSVDLGARFNLEGDSERSAGGRLGFTYKF